VLDLSSFKNATKELYPGKVEVENVHGLKVWILLNRWKNRKKSCAGDVSTFLSLKAYDSITVWSS
jgi:hypothetical protein